MRPLLDTHTFIWWDSEPNKLSPKPLALCQDNDNELILSVASLWEMQIKSQPGELKLSAPLLRLVEGQQKANALQLLSVEAPHVYELSLLPSLHKDPFDRVLVAQARVENLTIVTKDTFITDYPVQAEW